MKLPGNLRTELRRILERLERLEGENSGPIDPQTLSEFIEDLWAEEEGAEPPPEAAGAALTLDRAHDALEPLGPPLLRKRKRREAKVHAALDAAGGGHLNALAALSILAGMTDTPPPEAFERGAGRGRVDEAPPKAPEPAEPEPEPEPIAADEEKAKAASARPPPGPPYWSGRPADLGARPPGTWSGGSRREDEAARSGKDGDEEPPRRRRDILI